MGHGGVEQGHDVVVPGEDAVRDPGHAPARPLGDLAFGHVPGVSPGRSAGRIS